MTTVLDRHVFSGCRIFIRPYAHHYCNTNCPECRFRISSKKKIVQIVNADGCQWKYFYVYNARRLLVIDVNG